MIKLSDFVRTCYAPTFLYGQVKLRTIDAYLESIELFLKYVGDLRLDQLTPRNTVKFVQILNKIGLANETVRKHCGHLNILFSKMGPVGHRNRDALGFLKITPWIKPPRAFLKLPREVLDAQVKNLYYACSQTSGCYEYPKYLDSALAPKWWETLIQLTITTALRRQALLGLTWNAVDYGSRSLRISTDIDKVGRERIKPLHPVVLQALRTIRSDSPFLLPWIHSKKKFYEIWHEINETAGIMPRLTLHDLKRYALQRAERSGVDATTLQALGDHSSLQTTTNHYVRGNLEQYVIGMVLPGMEVSQ